MASGEIEDKPYNEGTLTKLALFELYARAWLPVFTSPPEQRWKRLHLFDFFAGKGRDCEGTPGSSARLATEISRRWQEIQNKNLQVRLTACDDNAAKTESLGEYLNESGRMPQGLMLDVRTGPFSETFPNYLPILRDPDTACLVLLDQYGFKEVGVEVFRSLTRCPATDILFFVSTQHLHRFADHPDVKKYIDLVPAKDYHHTPQQVLGWYRSQVPEGVEYYLAPFSFRKGSNIYSVIFGSGHPKGMEQFLSVAWRMDKQNGEADYDLNREDFKELEPFLPMGELFQPKKVQVFEASLEAAIRGKALTTEKDLYLFCLTNGMMPSHASSVLTRLKKEGAIECDFRSPRRESLKSPRPFKFC